MPHLHSAPTTAPSSRRWLALVPMLLGVLIGSLSLSSIITALPALLTELRLDPGVGVWIIDIYPLTLGVTLVLAARAGDHWGRRRIMVLGLGGFAVFNLIAGLQSTGPGLIALRMLLGISEAMVISSVVSTIGTQFHARERVLAYGFWTAAFGAGSAFGPLLGGVLTEGPGWRWIFLGCVPLSVIAVLAALRFVPEGRAPVRPHWDPLSIATSVLAIGGIVYALQHALAEPVAASVLAAAGYVFVRRQKTLDNPLIDVGIFRIRGFSIAYGHILVITGTTAATLYLVGQQVQHEQGLSPAEAGLVLLPLAALTGIVGATAPLALRWVSRKTITTLALAVALLGQLWLASGFPGIPVALGLIGAGFGAVGTLAAAALFDYTTPAQAGQVGAVQEVSFALGNGIGVAVFGTVALAAGPDGYRFAMLAAGAVLAAAVVVYPLQAVRSAVRDRGRRRRADRPTAGRVQREPAASTRACAGTD
ncbi:DHA2 family multidrug resistance protein-like MFS transporter [Arthrobacter woluwensis]|uniref:MFS transporter n=1 Tax=Arthrobacter woluwensis TaxID=156980 RepID=UPI00277F9442|nr:MFS transporter [Arthrobacter woluwensis]MDQ0708212.1 DHA2 family multidrug resistance protein-like MFS transporter [Arthrobacter woluwensis]